jgi:hypothetical protein
MNAQLESLESREVLSTSYSAALQAALSQGPGPHANRFAAAQHALPLARPGAPLRGAAGIALDGASNPQNAPSSALPNRRAALFAQVQARRAALASARAEAMARPWAARPSLRIQTPAPTTPVGSPTSLTTPNMPMTNNDDSGSDTQSLPANVSGVLNAIYQNYLKDSTLPVGDAPGSVRVEGSNVGVSIHGNGQGDFSAFVGTLQNLGMEVSATDSVSWTVAGMLPISQLLTAAQTPQTRSITPSYVPILK